MREFIEALLSGKFKTPHGDILFSPEQGRSHSINFVPYYFDAASTQRRQIYLGLSGDRRIRTDMHLIDWELKAAPTPFFNVQELCDEFLIGALRGDASCVEITANPVAAISQASVVEGVKAHLAIDLADGLSREKSSIGYRVFGRNHKVQRGNLSGASLSWANQGDVQQGVGEIEVPSGAVIDCIANYCGHGTTALLDY